MPIVDEAILKVNLFSLFGIFFPMPDDNVRIYRLLSVHGRKQIGLPQLLLTLRFPREKSYVILLTYDSIVADRETHMGQSDKVERFFQMCITLPFEEVLDDRGEDSVPELQHVADLRDSGSMQDAIDYGTSLMKMYPDNDLIPFMLGYIYYQKQFPREAMQLAVNAIPKCPRKYRLYSLAGLAEFDQGHLAEASVWWSRSVVAQCTVADYQEYDPFMHMAHAAELVGAKRESQLLFSMTDAIEASAPRLESAALEKLAQIRGGWVGSALVRVLKYLDEEFLHG